VPAGATREVLDLEGYLPHPHRSTGTAKFTQAESFEFYYGRHGGHDTYLWASQNDQTVTAVFDDDTETEAGWRQHRAVLVLEKTPEWVFWTGQDKQSMEQERFAEHIQDGLPQITEPAAASVLELVSDLRVTIKSTFDSSTNLKSGARTLKLTEEHNTGGGKTKTVDVPDLVTLAVAPWVGAAAFEIKARLRYRVQQGQLLWRYELVEPHVQLREAFRQVCDGIAAATEATVLHGVAPSPR